MMESSVDATRICQRCGRVKYSEYRESCPLLFNENRYNKAEEYKKYLIQFHVSAINPPHTLLSLIYTELWKVHMMLNNKIKLTTLTRILKMHGHYAWVAMTHRISKLLLAEKIPGFSDEVVDRLCYRFKQSKQTDNYTYDYLTRFFLILENLPEEAQCFGKADNLFHQLLKTAN